MGRLAGFKYRKIVKKLKSFGFAFYRYAKGSHEIWHNPHSGRFTTPPSHPGDISEGTLRAILKQVGISVEEFLNA